MAAQQKARLQLQRELGLDEMSPSDMYYKGFDRKYDSTQRFVLWMTARASGIAAGQPLWSFYAIDYLAAKYELNALAMQSELLTEMNNAAKTAADFRDIADWGTPVVAASIAGGERAMARSISAMVLAAARKSGNAELEKKATLRFLEAQKP